jgi:hypothetical protein
VARGLTVMQEVQGILTLHLLDGEIKI